LLFFPIPVLFNFLVDGTDYQTANQFWFHKKPTKVSGLSRNPAEILYGVFSDGNYAGTKKIRRPF
jgi:hypothetical protein